MAGVSLTMTGAAVAMTGNDVRNDRSRSMPEDLLAELPEDRATGAVAVIYDEIRRFSGVPYVSSLQRYLATMPGVLEWAWDALRPAMTSGTIPETGWGGGRADGAPCPPPRRAVGRRCATGALMRPAWPPSGTLPKTSCGSRRSIW